MERASKRHARMVGDPMRTAPLLRAVAKAVRPGDVVLDIGTGVGILAIAAAKAGAKRVVAIDCDAGALEEAARRAKKARVDDRIRFTQKLSFDLRLPRRADVILCETVGSFAFDENILATLSDAKRRLLTSGGRIVPTRVELWGAPCGVMPPIAPPAEIARMRPADLLAAPTRLSVADFDKFIPREVHAKSQFTCASGGTVRAVAVWPRVTWWEDEVTDASPLAAPTHWEQGILPVEARAVKARERISFELVIRPHPKDPKRMTERLWRWI